MTVSETIAKIEEEKVGILPDELVKIKKQIYILANTIDSLQQELNLVFKYVSEISDVCVAYSKVLHKIVGG